MNSFRVSPGLAVFMKVSPMRKPRKPAARRRQMVSGSEMPLSEDSQCCLNKVSPQTITKSGFRTSSMAKNAPRPSAISSGVARVRLRCASVSLCCIPELCQ